MSYMSYNMLYRVLYRISTRTRPYLFAPARRFAFFAAAAAAVLLFALPSSATAVPPFASYRDVPDVTDMEIAALNKLRERYKDSVLVYGMLQSSEAVVGLGGEAEGFAALVSEFMSEFFGITVKPKVLDRRGWDTLLSELESGAVSFTGELTPTDERRKRYLMTSPIANRYVVYFRMRGSDPLIKISETRRLRYGFHNDVSTMTAVFAISDTGKTDAVTAANIDEAVELLKSGKIDAFFDENVARDYYLEGRDFLVSDMLLPQIYEPVSITTRRIELASMISVLDKFLRHGGAAYFAELYRHGKRQYAAHRLLASLTEAELEYVNSRPTVKIAAEPKNYPLSFYNVNEKAWQGIALDALREIEELTGITFAIVNDERTEFATLLGMLENGEVSMITELIRTKERAGRFIWVNTPLLTTKYALISKSELAQLDFDDVINARVGVTHGTAYNEIFRGWFPEHKRISVFPNTGDLFDALESGSVDLVMSSRAQLLTVTNYMERPGYKVNILFEHSIESTFGFHKSDTLLCSVVDKAMKLVGIDNIADTWLYKTYDYRVKLMQSRQPLIAGICALLLCVIALLAIMYRNNRSINRHLETQVKIRTSKLDEQMNIMNAVTAHYKGVILHVDEDGILTMLNGAYLKHLDPNLRSVLGSNIRAVSKKYPYYSEIVDYVEKTFREGPQSWKFTAQGYSYLANTTPILDAAGKVVGVTGSVDDISEMVRLNSDLKTALDAAEAANRTKSAFLANMSHEIRTPMNSIVGFSELALDLNMSDALKEHIGKILENSKWLLQIINDILDVSKLEMGKMSLENIPFDLYDIFTYCRTSVDYMAQEKGLMLHFYAEPCVGKMLLGDPARLRQVFINLISNAIKFTNVGAIKVSATVTETTDDTITMRFEVKDSGIGLTAEQIARIFDPFVQADHSTTRKYGGTGLGLTIIKSIVELMGGTLSVKSAPGVGSNFSFDIKFKTVAAATGANAAASFADDANMPAFDGEVLVCEDNYMNQEVVRRHLERVGLRVAIAINGKICVDAVARRIEKGEKMFDMIFMDVNMPEMDGMEAAEKIRAMETDVPIVAMTANVMTSDIELYKKCGMRECLGKPFTSQELWNCLHKHIKPSEARRQQDSEAKRLGYDEELLAEMCAIFVNDNQNTFIDLMDAIGSGDITLAHRIAHTLKSNAGTIGKSALQDAAAEVEWHLKNGKNLVTEQMLNILDRELRSVLASLKSAASPNVGNNRTEKCHPAPDTFMEELIDLLRQGNPACLKFKEALRMNTVYEKLVRQMEDYDFDDALKTLTHIKQNSGEGAQ